MNAHTPGPWKWEENTLYGAAVGAIHGGETCVEVGHLSTDCGDHVISYSAGELTIDDCCAPLPCSADLRLIAAAPEMLEFINRFLILVTAIECAKTILTDQNGVKINLKMIADVRALVKRIDGDS